MKQFGLIILAALLLQGCGNSGKPKNEGAENVVKKAKVERAFHTGKNIGVGGEISPQWEKSDSLCAHVSTDELIKLASKHEDKIERLIAFHALLMKNPHEAVNLAIAEIEDTALVSTLNGCEGTEEYVSDVRICMIQYNREQYKVSKEDSVRIDSAVLFSENGSKFYYMYRLYHRLPAKPEYENRLRQLYKQDCYALIPLARYHRDEEEQEIIRLLSEIDNKNLRSDNDTIRTVLDAVAAWPSASFKQQVRQICQKILSTEKKGSCTRSAFGALIAYNEQWSYNIIEKALSRAKQSGNDYFNFFWSFHEAYEDNPQPLFKPLIKKYPLE